MKNVILGSLLWMLAVLASGQAAAQGTLLLRQPALSAEHLAFVYAGDLWIAQRDGSAPRRLTSHAADENIPIFSPDGSKIAYAASYDDNTDAYVISVDGGQPQRLTWHPAADVPLGWTPDGSAVALVSNRETDQGRSGQLYHAALAGGLPQKQMQARIYRGAYDAEGKRLAYIAFGAGYNGLFGGSAGWRGYRGGTTPSIRILDLANNRVTAIPGERVTDFNPFWLDGQVYFLSDREDTTFNLYRYDPASAAITRLSHETQWDIRSASGHNRAVVYEAGGVLKQLDLSTGEIRALPVQIAPDLAQLQPAWKSVAANIETIGLSPSGKRALITARGEVFSLPAKDGSPRNLSASDGVREYSALWSPDGNQIAWIVDGRDGQSLVLADQHGKPAAKRYPLGPHFYTLLAWHAETKRIAFADNHLGLHSIDLGRGSITDIATGTRRDNVEAAFSPDGQWLAYTREQPNYNRDLYLYAFANGKSQRVSDGMADVAAPAFSRDGKVLYFAASTNSGPIQVGLNMSSQERPYRAGIYAAVLTADGRSPLAPRSGDENAADDKADADKDKKDDKAAAKKPAPVTIALADIAQRIVSLPVPEGNYSLLQTGSDDNLYFLEQPQPGATVAPPETPPEAGSQLRRFAFKSSELSTVLKDLSDFRISADGKQMLVRLPADKLAIAELGKDKELKPEPVDLGGLRLRIDPRREWAQIFDDVWRMEKEYFYADNLHGLDWAAVYARYRPLLAHVGRREDLNQLLVEMIAELQAGHNRVGGGDVYKANGAKVGLLGANFSIDNGHYRITRIYNGERWNPFLRGPLAVPGNEAREGEYLLAIAGQPLAASDNLFARLQNTIDQQLTLRVGPNADGRNARDIVVQPIASETELRLWSWVEGNRRWIDQASSGKVGYIYLPNTAGAGYTFFNRMFFNQIDKQALIIDERGNGGGQAANYIVEMLSRRHLSGWKDRDGLPYNTPAGALHGPKLMMIDQDAGSGGDYLPYAFRELGIGPLLGTRTWGGLIGIYTNPLLVDGGTLTVPFFRFYDTKGQWSVENEGVAPDIAVELDPLASNAGRDSQLERASAEILKMLESYHDNVPRQPPPLPTQLGR
ncbi:MAG: PDZ domain-containing protein [Xanthomonadaceae bacterium]|nr:PDZ domain-containing protein [Xanthomonadaceae bacterium]MDP2184635.1 PDZ domain-containing protein [Xanthomonadales bacterium]MDZ4117193.1 PDZ domain-containing protein [Xanthomonadaceae bacterium]MDZ4377131.1 PDZ domain-containing protein [Xanthomonadaceae bacterium]